MNNARTSVEATVSTSWNVAPPTITYSSTEIHAMKSYLLSHGVAASFDGIIARINDLETEHHYEVCNRMGECTCTAKFQLGYQHPLPVKAAA